MKNKPKRIPLQVKLLEANYNKIKKESEKLGITMSAFLSMLIFKYEGIEILSDDNKKDES